MKNFIVIYHAPQDFMNQAAGMAPEERKKEEMSWMVWAEKCGNKLVDMGAPLSGGVKLNPNGKSTDSDKDVVGYSILQADNMNEAKSLLEGHLHLEWNADCGIDIHETMKPPGM